MQEQLIVRHPVFGNIRIGPKYEKVLNLKPFLELKEKSQLGSIVLSKKYLNARHTRYMHSIGVFYLTGKLLDVCKEKFGNYIEISEKDREVLQLIALGHDIGHVAFSHTLEFDDKPSHEERTIHLFKEYSETINEIFGYDIVSSVIQIFKNNLDIKEHGNEIQPMDNLDIQFIFKSLLIGTIDCDRIEYITSDRFNIFGELIDYTEIFQYITIVLLEGSPTLGFEKDAIPIIEKLLLNRFSQYAEIYFGNDSTLFEMLLKLYFKYTNHNYDYITNMSESHLLIELKQNLIDEEHNFAGDVYISQKATFSKEILGIDCSSIFFKKFDNKKDFDFFISKLKAITNNPFVVTTAHKKIEIYNSEKNKVYIVNDDGVVHDILDLSTKLKDCSIDYYYVMCKINIANLSTSQEKQIQSLFNTNNVEIEKKFILSNSSNNLDELKSNITNTLKRIPNISLLGDDWIRGVNNDFYYDVDKSLLKDITIRYRENESTYYIKVPASDGTSITKREEHIIFCKDESEFFNILNNFLISNGYTKKKVSVSKGITITTKRYKRLVSIYNSIIEISIDFSTYEYGEKKSNGVMIECELKEGDDIALWYLSKHLITKGFEETNDSKLKCAKRALDL